MRQFWLILLALSGLVSPAFAQDPPTAAPAVAVRAPLPIVPILVKDRDFREITPALPTTTTPGVTEVIVFFYYNSPWSAQMAPYLQDWAAEAGPAVHIQWAPAVLDPVWGYGARVFFALDQVGAAAITPKLLQAYDQHLLTYGDSAALVKWLSEQGVQGDDFAHALDDGRVRAHTAWTPTVMTLYGVHSVPTFVINGRYVIEANADTPVPLAVARVRYLVQHLQTPAPTP